MDWKPIEEFPGYSVSDTGMVRNDSTDRIMALSPNQHGIMQVGLMRNLVQYKRGVALLVAKAFLEPHSVFNTPINLDGDRANNHIYNLAWRPRWFAIMYHRQFFNDKRGFAEPIVETRTGELFESSWEAAIKYGLLDREILIATLNRTYVWPTFQEFRLVD